MVARVLILVGSLVVALAGWPLLTGTGSSAAAPAVAPEFADYYAAAGGAGILGAPVSGRLWREGRVAQYFERVRLERQPADGAVQLGRLGAELTAGRVFAPVAPFDSTPERWFLTETGHSVAEPFLSAWLTRGGVALFGLPISEPLTEAGRTVQYFERARFEWHPERAGGPDEVQFGALGREAWQAQVHALTQPADATGRLAALLNEARAQAGLPALAIDQAVAALADERAADMAARRYFAHTTPEGRNVLAMLPERGIGFQYAGETLQRNNFPAARTVDEAARSLLASPPHRAILLHDRFDAFGLGHAVDGGMHYYVVILVQY